MLAYTRGGCRLEINNTFFAAAARHDRKLERAIPKTSFFIKASQRITSPSSAS